MTDEIPIVQGFFCIVTKRPLMTREPWTLVSGLEKLALLYLSLLNIQAAIQFGRKPETYVRRAKDISVSQVRLRGQDSTWSR